MNEEQARERLLEVVETLAEGGWNEERIRAEFEYALEVARDEGALTE